MFSAGSLQAIDLLKLLRVETECSKELADYLLRQNFDVELSALVPEIFTRQLGRSLQIQGKRQVLSQVEKNQKKKKSWPRFLFRTRSHVSFTSARSSL